jgi:hypothetical protein
MLPLTMKKMERKKREKLRQEKRNLPQQERSRKRRIGIKKTTLL